MMFFWCVMSIMVLLCMSFVILPLLRNPRRVQTSCENTYTHTRDITTAVLLAIILPALALSLYLKWGDSTEVAAVIASHNNAVNVRQALAEFKNPEQIISKMQSVLQTHPESARGWFLLGRLYMSLGRYHEAAQAFAKADALKPHVPEVMLQYAESLFFSNEKDSAVKAVGIATAVLALQPQNEAANDEAINLLALNAYRNKHYQQAIDYWERLLPSYEPSSSDAKILLQAIATAQKQLNQRANRVAAVCHASRKENERRVQSFKLASRTEFVSVINPGCQPSLA